MNTEPKINTRISMRRFVLLREEDETGMSGTGIVAEGAEFSGGKVVLQFRSHVQSIIIYDSIKAVKEIHGHADSKTTKIVWKDADPNAEDQTLEEKEDNS